MTQKPYNWSSKKLPLLEAHSAAKHQLLKSYLERYVATIIKNSKQDSIRLNIIDGFCGGGVYSNAETGEVCSGSPLIFLETITNIENTINATGTRKARIDARYFFVDNDSRALSSLKSQLCKRGFSNLIGERIFLLNGKFSELCAGIIEMVSARKGYSIFLLDQYGYKDVPLPLIRKIFRQIPNAEILLTFSVDTLINYMSNTARFRKCIRNLNNKCIILKDDEFDNIDKLKQSRVARKSSALWRKTVEATLLKRLIRMCGAKYYTPYLITSGRSHRSYWFLHLSMKIKSWDEMLKLQWQQHNNTAIHANREMLGFNPHSSTAISNNNKEDKCAAILIKKLPSMLYRYKKGISFHELISSKGKNSISHSGIFKKAIHTLQSNKTIKIQDHKTGKERQNITSWNNIIRIRKTNSR